MQYALDVAAAKYFEITQPDATASPPDLGGLIKLKAGVKLDHEAKASHSVVVTATDPFLKANIEQVTVTIHVLDVPEIIGLASRIRVNENTKEIVDLSASDPRNDPNEDLGGLKWSLLTTNEPAAIDASPNHNRTDEESIDCQADPAPAPAAGAPSPVHDPDNPLLPYRCDDLRFDPQNTAATTLRFAIGKDNKAPDFEKPADVGINATPPHAVDPTSPDHQDNVYKIVVRLEFAKLRSDDGEKGPNHISGYHPNPEMDESQDKTVWVRVDDLDEVPAFSDPASAQFVTENLDDVLPAIAINRVVHGAVEATDPEYDDGEHNLHEKKLTYSLSLPGAYEKMFQVVPATGEILTRGRVDFESLDLAQQGTPGALYKTIAGVKLTARDSSGIEANSATIDVNIDVRDVNERPIATAGPVHSR